MTRHARARMSWSTVATLLLLASSQANAAPWTVQPGSSLGFSASFQDEAFEGNFSRFTPRISFDPATATGHFDVAIDLLSADTRNSERDDLLHGAEFFNARKHPQARYVASRFRALGAGKFIANGVLTLNGISKPVALAFTWSAGAKPVLAGQATLKRLDFSVGIGDWSETALLPNAVQVKTRLLLAPVARSK